MGITGNLKTMALAELLQWLSQGQKTGTLVFDSGRVEKRVFFEDGTIISSASTDKSEYLGNFLAAHGHVTEQQVDEALARQKEEGKLLGKLLIELGAINEEALQEVLQLKAEECIYDIFTWEQGDFRFLDGELPEQTMVPMSLDVQWIVLEGSRRVDEIGRLREFVPSPMAVAVSVVDLEAIEIEDTEARILSWVDDDRTVEEISRDAQTTQFLVTQVLAAQVQAGNIKMVRPRIIETAPPAQRDSGEVEMTPQPMQQPTLQQPTLQQPVTLPQQVYAQAPPPGYPPQHYMPVQPPAAGQSLDSLRSHPSFSGVGSAAAPSPTPSASLPPEIAAMIEEGERAVTTGELDSALRAFKRAKDSAGGDTAVDSAVTSAEKKLEGALENAGITLKSVPRLSCDMTSLTKLDISPSEGFMLTRVNGSFDIKSLLKMHPAPALDVQVLFWKLKKSGHVAF